MDPEHASSTWKRRSTVTCPTRAPKLKLHVLHTTTLHESSPLLFPSGQISYTTRNITRLPPSTAHLTSPHLLRNVNNLHPPPSVPSPHHYLPLKVHRQQIHIPTPLLLPPILHPTTHPRNPHLPTNILVHIDPILLPHPPPLLLDPRRRSTHPALLQPLPPTRPIPPRLAHNSALDDDSRGWFARRVDPVCIYKWECREEGGGAEGGRGGRWEGVGLLEETRRVGAGA